MKHIKKHPINDKSQKLSKDMKKQELVKPKTDKVLDADKSLSDPKISKRVVKPSNKKLSSEKHLSGKKAKKVNEDNQSLKNLKRFNEFLDPMGKWTMGESEKENGIGNEYENMYNDLSIWLSDKGYETISTDNESSFKRQFIEILKSSISNEEKATNITNYIDDNFRLENGSFIEYAEVMEYIENLLN